MWFDIPMKYLPSASMIFLVLICLSPVQAENSVPKQLVGWKQELIAIEKVRGENVVINAYIADTPAKRAQGLMHVTDLPENAGMLLVFSQPRQISIWMKNTLISLDILFLNPSGRIVKIHKNAEPLSLASVPSHARVKWVLELNAGVAGKLNLRLGDRLARGKID
tara:strand:+ start:97 stop:591 length:495 start_codon:yes stop_codon:yes gene_type:complete